MYFPGIGEKQSIKHHPGVAGAGARASAIPHPGLFMLPDSRPDKLRNRSLPYETGLLIQGVPGVPQDPFAPHPYPGTLSEFTKTH